MKLLTISLILSILVSCTLFYKTLEAPYKHDPLSDGDSSHPVQIYWIGHASFLIKIYDRWIATDPNFSDRIGIILRRFVEAGIRIDRLPKIDSILISHTHFDHLDQPSLRMLKGSGKLFVPAGGKTYIPPGLFDEVIGVSKYDSFKSSGLTITAVPVRHFGGRWLIDNLWDGDPYTAYVMQYRDITIYFAGDTGYDSSLFKETGNKFPIDIALIPAGPVGFTTNLSRLGNSVHVNPYGAIEIFKDTGAKAMIPMHHSTFYRRGGKEERMLYNAVDNSGIRDKIYILDIGQRIIFTKEKGELKAIR